jgi:NAD(P)-dependent dehydrogenase (short-subunit alcohol dehydrogenase family)
MRRLEGKGAVVIGAGGKDNIGQSIARRFADEGAKVVVAGRKIEELERFAKEIDGFAIGVDITVRDSVQALFENARKKLGNVQIAVNSTGWGFIRPFLSTTPDELRDMAALQFMGPFYFLQAAVEAMEHGGSIIQISSATATIMHSDHAAYMGTKAGIDHVVRCVANEFGARGIRANSISPGLTNTPMTSAGMIAGIEEAFLPGYPLGRIGTPQDIAAAAAWLASDECFMTGQNLQVNGGLTLRRNPTRAEIVAAVNRAAEAQAK